MAENFVPTVFCYDYALPNHFLNDYCQAIKRNEGEVVYFSAERLLGWGAWHRRLVARPPRDSDGGARGRWPLGRSGGCSARRSRAFPLRGEVCVIPPVMGQGLACRSQRRGSLKPRVYQQRDFGIHVCFVVLKYLQNSVLHKDAFNVPLTAGDRAQHSGTPLLCSSPIARLSGAG